MYSDCTYDNIPPQMKILNKAFLILMHFCSFVSNCGIASRMSSNKIQCKLSGQTIFDAGYTAANFLRNPIRLCVTKASALEYRIFVVC